MAVIGLRRLFQRLFQQFWRLLFDPSKQYAPRCCTGLLAFKRWRGFVPVINLSLIEIARMLSKELHMKYVKPDLNPQRPAQKRDVHVLRIKLDICRKPSLLWFLYDLSSSKNSNGACFASIARSSSLAEQLILWHGALCYFCDILSNL